MIALSLCIFDRRLFISFLRPAKKRNNAEPLYVNTGASRAVKVKRDHFSDYILEDNTLKKVPRIQMGAIQNIRGEWRSLDRIIHFQNDKIPEPIDNIHTFSIEFPTPGVTNWVPTSDDDYLVLPRIRDISFRVLHDTVAVIVPGTDTHVPEMRTKSVALWASTESVAHYQKANPELNVLDIRDLQMKYQPRGLLHYRLKGQRVSCVDNQDYKLAGLKGSEKASDIYDKIVALPEKRPAADSSGMQVYTFNMDYEPTPQLVTPVNWDRETGQCFGNSMFIHMWLENGVWDPDSTIYFHVKWSLEKVTAKDMWYHDNAMDTRKKMIESGAFLKQEIDALKEKEQIFYTVLDTHADQTSYEGKYFAWKSYIEEGRFVQHLNTGVLESTQQEDKTPGLHLNKVDDVHPEWVAYNTAGDAPAKMPLEQPTNPTIPFPEDANANEGTSTGRGALLEASDNDPEELVKLDEDDAR